MIVMLDMLWPCPFTSQLTLSTKQGTADTPFLTGGYLFNYLPFFHWEIYRSTEEIFLIYNYDAQYVGKKGVGSTMQLKYYFW